MKNWIESAADFVKQRFTNEYSGHDYWHIVRVVNNAKYLVAHEENVDADLVELSAWLHDVGDHKFFDGDEAKGHAFVRQWMVGAAMPEMDIERVMQVISEVSFKGAHVQDKPTSKEAQIVQDADRLDAIGALGIARAFAFGGSRDRLMYDPGVAAEQHDSFEAYKNGKGTTVNHFYEKLLLLKDRMHTDTARKLAEERHRFMEQFLDRFYREWEGEV